MVVGAAVNKKIFVCLFSKIYKKNALTHDEFKISL